MLALTPTSSGNSAAIWSAVAALAAAVSAALSAAVVYVEFCRSRRASVVIMTERRVAERGNDYYLVFTNVGRAVARDVTATVRKHGDSVHLVAFGSDVLENGVLEVAIGYLAPQGRAERQIFLTMSTNVTHDVTGTIHWQDNKDRSDHFDLTL